MMLLQFAFVTALTLQFIVALLQENYKLMFLFAFELLAYAYIV